MNRHFRHPIARIGLAAVAPALAITFIRLAIATESQPVWTSLGPEGTYVTALVVDPQQPATLFVGTDRGVYKTTDGGRGWQAVNAGLTSPLVTALAIDPHTPSTIYASVARASAEKLGGVFRSADGGATWHASGTGLRSIDTIHALAIDPRTPTILYAAAGSGIFKTADGGATWYAASAGIPTYDSISIMAIDPRTPTTLYAGARSRLFKSTDGGQNWRVIAGEVVPPNESDVADLAIDPQTSTTIYVGTDGRGIFKSTDAGGSWRAINTGLTDLRVNTLTINPTTPTTLHAGTWHGVFQSTDGGGSWHALNAGLADLSVVALAVDPRSPTSLYAGTWGTGVFTTSSVSGVPAPQSPADTGSVTYVSIGEDESVWMAIEIRGDLPTYAGSRKALLFKASSTQRDWKKVLEISGHGAVGRLWFFGSGRITAWVVGDSGSQDGLIMRTADGGGRWSSSHDLDEDIRDISFVTPTRGWMLGSAGSAMGSELSEVYATVDGGGHWTKVAATRGSGGLGSEYKTGIEFRDASNGWIGTNNALVTVMPGFYMSRDGGRTWAYQSLPPPTGTPQEWMGKVMPPRFFGRAGVAVARLLDGAAVLYVYATTDAGRTWGNARRIPGLEEYPDPLPVDFFTPTIWAAGAGRTLFFTADAGRTWSQHSVPLPSAYEIERVSFVGPARIWVIGITEEQGGRGPIADYVLEMSDAGRQWTRVPLPQIR